MITLDEAIEILSRPKTMKGTPQDILEAHDMAITALRQPEIIRCKECKHKFIKNGVWTCPFGLPGGELFFCGYGIRSEDRHDAR